MREGTLNSSFHTIFYFLYVFVCYSFCFPTKLPLHKCYDGTLATFTRSRHFRIIIKIVKKVPLNASLKEISRLTDLKSLKLRLKNVNLQSWKKNLLQIKLTRTKEHKQVIFLFMNNATRKTSLTSTTLVMIFLQPIYNVFVFFRSLFKLCVAIFLGVFPHLTPKSTEMKFICAYSGFNYCQKSRISAGKIIDKTGIQVEMESEI